MKVALIGCGRVFEHYIRILSSISDISISGVYDVDLDVQKRLADTYFLYSSLEECFSSDADLICILTPSSTHYELAMQAVISHKDVLVEKPLTLLPSQAHKLVSISDSSGVRLYCAFQNRFNDAVVEAKKVIEQGHIGEIISCHIALEWCRYQSYYDDNWHGRWALDGGVIAQQAVHHIDAALTLLGKPERVLGVGRKVCNQLEAEDTFSGLIELTSGLVITLSASTSFRPADKQASITIAGTSGSLHINGIGLNNLQVDFKDNSYKVSETFENGYGLGHRRLLNAIKNVLDGSKPCDNLNIYQSVLTTEVISAFYSSWEQSAWAAVGTCFSERWGLTP